MDITAARVFCAVAEQQSFTKAAERLGLDKSSVSRIVRTLEDAVGVELLRRTTRSVRPTPEGLDLLQRLQGPLTELDTVFQTFSPSTADAQGLVTIATTTDLAQTYLLPALAAFRLRHPKVTVRLELSNKLLDLVADGVDLALRVGKPGGEAIVAKKVGVVDLGFFASPGYLERRGIPTDVTQTRFHETLWPAMPKGARYASAWAPPSVECADFTLLANAAHLGAGIALLPIALARPAVASGQLIRVLSDVTLGHAPIYVVSRAVKRLPARVHALRTFLLGLTYG